MMQTQNEEYVQLLQGMMGDDLDADVARRVLAKHNNDIQAAASAILEGDRGEDFNSVNTWSTEDPFDTSAGGSGALNVPRRTNTPRTTPERGQPSTTGDVIDLTADNDSDLSRALQLSLEQGQSQRMEGNFRRTDRAPDPNWAMVPSNVQVNTNTVQEQEDQSLSRAIEASLSTSYVEDRYEELPIEEKVRKAGYPVSLRTSLNELYFAPPIIQALFYVPQVRQKLATWRWEGSNDGLLPDKDSPDYIPCVLSGLFTFMDHTLVSYLLIDELGFEYRGRLASSAADLPGELSNEFYSFIVRAMETKLRADSQKDGKRLFHLRYAPINSVLPADAMDSNTLGIENCPPTYLKSGSETACVRVDLRASSGPSDLLTCLSNQLGLEPPSPSDITNNTISSTTFSSQAQALVTASDVIAFELVRPSHSLGSSHSTSQQNASSSTPSVTPFRYPMNVYLDQFLLENAAVACERRVKRREMEARLKELTAKRESLTQFEGKATVKSLTSALYYFENVAIKDGNESRAQEVEAAAASLQKIINRINTEVQVLDSQILKLRSEIEKVFDDLSLQQHRYDLRAVLVHDGLYGRSHLHSFILDNGRWWKCQDATVVETRLVFISGQGHTYSSTVGKRQKSTSSRVGPQGSRRVYSYSAPFFALTARLQNNIKTDNFDYLQLLEQVAPEIAANLGATYNPSPILVPTSLLEEEPVGYMPRRSISAMSVVEEEPVDEEVINESMDWKDWNSEAEITHRSDETSRSGSNELKGSMSAMSVVDNEPGDKEVKK
ncbi:hypothetical protein A7U60_g3695 [Sanghuangporus baumii]|uniref:USP domain-containing protein n=1 Tax=Sanghuangporus baumii TaxID=108892 RepID=A0A9Q5NCZ8_SANBA|nr:hypothetical protein A7U60_g3695 [Sanghuangporus baumii]